MYNSNGSPYVYFSSSNGIKIATKNTASIWYNQGNIVGVEVDVVLSDNSGVLYSGTDLFALYAPSGANWTVETNNLGNIVFTSDLAGKDYCSVVYIPDEGDESKRIEALNYFKQFAYNFVTDTKVNWVYDEENSEVRTTFTATVDQKEGNSNKVAFALYPHQWLNYDGEFKPYSYNSARGEMKLIETNGSFSTELTHYGILNHFPLAANETSA